MHRLLLALLLLAVSAPFAYAGVRFTSPAGGATIQGGGRTLSIEWEDDGQAPSLSDMSTYQLFLCAGGNTEGQYIQVMDITTQGQFAAGNRAAASIPATAGASTPQNAYFIKMTAVATAGGQTTTFSKRFTLSGMTGSFPANIVTALQSVTGTDGPRGQNNVAAGPGVAATGDYAVPFAEQTGLTRYAPMQSIPPTKITKNDYVPLYPTSAVQYARTFLPPASVQTTVTQSQTYTPSFRENPASPAPNPHDDMAKFLARWKD